MEVELGPESIQPFSIPFHCEYLSVLYKNCFLQLWVPVRTMLELSLILLVFLGAGAGRISNWLYSCQLSNLFSRSTRYSILTSSGIIIWCSILPLWMFLKNQDFRGFRLFNSFWNRVYALRGWLLFRVFALNFKLITKFLIYVWFRVRNIGNLLLLLLFLWQNLCQINFVMIDCSKRLQLNIFLMSSIMITLFLIFSFVMVDNGSFSIIEIFIFEIFNFEKILIKSSR